MSGADRSAVADDVEDALQGLGIEELNARAGYQPGRGCVHPAEAADEILDEVLQPFLDDLQRRPASACDLQPSNLRRASCSACTTAATATPRRCWSIADSAAERASGVVSDCARLGIELPASELLDLMPEWSAVLR
jgi:hypothetical protein